jgi:hypothetical protein
MNLKSCASSGEEESCGGWGNSQVVVGHDNGITLSDW